MQCCRNGGLDVCHNACNVHDDNVINRVGKRRQQLIDCGARDSRRPRFGLTRQSHGRCRLACSSLLFAFIFPRSSALEKGHAFRQDLQLRTDTPIEQVQAVGAGKRRPAEDLIHSRGSHANYSLHGRAVRAVDTGSSPVCDRHILSTGPWIAFRCWKATDLLHEGLALIGTSGNTYTWTLDVSPAEWPRMPLDKLVGVLIFIVWVSFGIYGLKDVHRFIMLLAHWSVDKRQRLKEDNAKAEYSNSATPSEETGQANVIETADPGKPEAWSVLAIVGLTSYRFYTGFLSATWLPYLLAMEGQDLWHEKQSMFMGYAKLIYGATILLNPVFGLVGDQAVALSHGVGRRLFVRIGLTTAAVGIYICVLSARNRAFLSFLSGILIWRLGEALNDVTTEALVPEMVPQDQYQMASGIKSSMFLLGGLLGYSILLVYSDLHYSWLYYAYPLGMFTCAMPSLFLLDQDHPFPPTRQQMARKALEDDEQEQEPFLKSLAKSYLTPLAYKGGFARACFAVFIFSLGTAPMFFLLLIVRDLVGIRDPELMQQHFSAGSICFFLSAAISSVAVACLDPAKRQLGKNSGEVSPKSSDGARAWASAELLAQRGKLLTIAMVSFGVIVLLLPTLALFEDADLRDRAYYSITILFGTAFGVSFALFQDLTWQILPPEVNFANAMGFNVMSRLLGVGLGNFFCGVILDVSLDKTGAKDSVYAPVGYVIMCTFSGLAVLLSTAVASNAIKISIETDLKERDRPDASSSVLPAA